MEYEHKILVIEPLSSVTSEQNSLNDFGGKGWRLVNSIERYGAIYHYLIRELRLKEN